MALGGNALLERGEAADAATRQLKLEVAATGLAALAAEHELVVLGAEGDGTVGHGLELALRNALPERDVVTVLTEVVVDLEDPAFARPSKPVGPLYSAEQAGSLAEGRGWTVGGEDGGYRRLLPSPEPHAVAELPSLRRLVDGGALVVCAGGGGLPVTVDAMGMMRRVRAVVDEDLTAALLARRLGADLLLMLTDVDAIHLGWGTERDTPIHRAEPAQLREHEFAVGSMAPKVEAACRFVEATGRRAAVGSLADAARIVSGAAGTQVAPHAAAPAIA